MESEKSIRHIIYNLPDIIKDGEKKARSEQRRSKNGG